MISGTNKHERVVWRQTSQRSEAMNQTRPSFWQGHAAKQTAMTNPKCSSSKATLAWRAAASASITAVLRGRLNPWLGRPGWLIKKRWPPPPTKHPDTGEHKASGQTRYVQRSQTPEEKCGVSVLPKNCWAEKWAAKHRRKTARRVNGPRLRASTRVHRMANVEPKWRRPQARKPVTVRSLHDVILCRPQPATATTTNAARHTAERPRAVRTSPPSMDASAANMAAASTAPTLATMPAPAIPSVPKNMPATIGRAYFGSKSPNWASVPPDTTVFDGPSTV